MSIKEIYEQTLQIEQLFPAERSRIFFEKNAYDFLCRQYKHRFCKEKFELYNKQFDDDINVMQFRIQDFEDYYELYREENQE